jgi:hypothetical protein
MSITNHRTASGRRSPHHARRIRTAVAGASVLVAVIAVACAPAGRTRSASELGVRVARDVSTTTLAPAPPVDPLVPVTTSPAGAPTTAPPATTTPATTTPAAMTPVTAPSNGRVTAGSRLGVGGCALFPRDNAFHAEVSSLSVKADSDRTIAAVGGSVPLRTFFGSAVWQGSRPGIPVNVVDTTTAARRDLLVSQEYQYASEPLGVPWPDTPRFEGWPGRAWDRHLLVVDSATCRSWELINVQSPIENVFGTLFNMWYADKVVTVDLSSNQHRVNGTVTAAGFSMLAGLVRYDEVASGSVDHAVSIVLPTVRQGAPTWPAQGTDGRSTDPAAPPMGTWLRLKAGADLRGLGPQATVIARALQAHGAIVSDSGPNAALSGEPDVRWNDTDLSGLGRLTMSDFEVVDASPMKVSDQSLQIR